MATGRILVVDDDANLVEVLKLRIESAGYEVTAAPGEEEALAVAGEPGPDLAIIDLQLGKSDGIALMQKLHLLLPDLPVIILTAHGTIESAVEAMRKGAYSYVTKPFEARNLLLQIDKAIEKDRKSVV